VIKENVTLAVVIPTFQAGSMLSEAIGSVRKSSQFSNLKVVIVVVDNHEFCADKFYAKDADLYLPTHRNRGFGYACNLGIIESTRKFSIDYVMLLNPDASVASDFFFELQNIINSQERSGLPNPICPLICFEKRIKRIQARVLFDERTEKIEVHNLDQKLRLYDSRNESFVSNLDSVHYLTTTDEIIWDADMNLSTIFIRKITKDGVKQSMEILDLKLSDIQDDAIVQNAGSQIQSKFAAGDRGTGKLASKLQDLGVVTAQAWCGAGVVLAREYLERVGMFDETFFLYYEDTEFSYRGLKLGLVPSVYPKLMIYHKHSAITGRQPKTRTRNVYISRQIFIVRTSGMFTSSLFILGLILKSLYTLLRGHTTIRHFRKFFLFEIYCALIGQIKAIRPRKTQRFGS
jgi:GT2 family glycosyltransferase